MRIDICIPVHNEERILETNALRVLRFCRTADLGHQWQLVLLVNGSTDASAEIARELARQHEEIISFDTPQRGRGNALARYWRRSRADIVAYMDSDLAVSLTDLPSLLAPVLNGATLSIGCRLHPRSVVGRSGLRELISRIYNSLARMILGHSRNDLQCGFKAVRREAFVALAPLLRDQHWFFDTELVVWAGKLRHEIVEIPVNWQETRFGSRPSKVRLLRDTFSFVRRLLELRLRLRRFDKNHPLG